MATVTLQDCIEPSRAAVKPLAATKGAKAKAKRHAGDVELPDYVAPEPKTQMERREWDRMSSRMEGFHSYFRLAFKQLFELSDGSFEKRGMSVRDFMSVCEDFHEHLGFHHGIEERCVFFSLSPPRCVY